MDLDKIQLLLESGENVNEVLRFWIIMDKLPAIFGMCVFLVVAAALFWLLRREMTLEGWIASCFGEKRVGKEWIEKCVMPILEATHEVRENTPMSFAEIAHQIRMLGRNQP